MKAAPPRESRNALHVVHAKLTIVFLAPPALSSVALLPRVPVAGGFHGGCDCRLSDHGAVLQPDSGLGRDEHQRGLVPAGARLCHVSFHPSTA